jgi:sugar-specific transcriptional regulator TrmB
MDNLEYIGLTKNESKVYLTLLKIGTAKSGNILQSSGLNSGKIYEILESLKEKGLISETVIDNKRNFTAAPPKQLISYIDKKRKELDDKEKTLKITIPQLEKLRSETLPQKKILTYIGFRGIITAAEEALENTSKGEEILSMGVSDINSKYQFYWNKWEKLRQQKRISARYILSEKGKIYNDLKKEKNIQTKILSLKTPVGVDIYGKDKVLILHYQEPVSCTLIYDEHTAQSFRQFFEPLWNIAKK